LLGEGYDNRTVQDLMGHKDVRTTMIYTHVLSPVVVGELEAPLIPVRKDIYPCMLYGFHKLESTIMCLKYEDYKHSNSRVIWIICSMKTSQ